MFAILRSTGILPVFIIIGLLTIVVAFLKNINWRIIHIHLSDIWSVVIGIIGGILVIGGVAGYFIPSGRANAFQRPTRQAADTPAMVANTATATPTITLTSTSSPIPTPTENPFLPTSLIPAATFTPNPAAGDFEAGSEQWGDFSQSQNFVPGTAVQQYCGAFQYHHSGNCSLQYQRTNLVNQNLYVGRAATANDAGSLISMWVYVPNQAACTNNPCLTANVIVWDQKYGIHEGTPVSLTPSQSWVEIKLDLRGKTLPEPYKMLGVHFVVNTLYRGNFYIDSVSVTKP